MERGEGVARWYHVTAVDVVPEKVEKINHRISPIQDDYIEKYLAEKDLDLTATLEDGTTFFGSLVVNDLAAFKARSRLRLAKFRPE